MAAQRRLTCAISRSREEVLLSSKRPTVLSALLALGVTSAQAAITEVQTHGGASDGALVTALTLTLASPTTLHDTVVVTINRTNLNTNVLNVTDDAPGGSSEYQFLREATNATTERVALWATPVGSVKDGAAHLTVTLGSSSEVVVEVVEYAGVAAFGQGSSSSGNDAAPAVFLTTQDADNWIVVGFGAHGAATFTQGSGQLRNQDITALSPATSRLAGTIVDNFASAAQPVSVTVNLTAAEPWAATAVELRSSGALDAGGTDGGNGSGDGGNGPRALGVGCDCETGGASAALLALVAASGLLNRAARAAR